MAEIGADQDNSEHYFRWWKILLVFATVLVFSLLIGVIPWVTFQLRPDWATTFPNEVGLWGDSFGFVNAMLSALAFAGVLVTLWMQRRELQLQREEMKLSRDEMKATRLEHQRMAKSQEESENRLFLAAYMSALESLRQLSQWRMSADPATFRTATFPVVEGLVIQARVSQSLQLLVRELEPEIKKLYPSTNIVTEKGSRVWVMEGLLNVHLSFRSLIESHGNRHGDSSAFKEAMNITRLQYNALRDLRNMLGPKSQAAIDGLLVRSPDSKWMTNNVDEYSIEQRQKHFSDLANTNRELLSLIMGLCHE